MKIKKIIASFLALSICAFYVPLSPVSEFLINSNYTSVFADEISIFEDINNSNIKYTLKGNTITIVSCTMENNTVVIPPYVTREIQSGNSTVQKILPVTHISSEAFADKQDMKILEIPEYTSVPSNCFEEFNNLETLSFYEHTFAPSDENDSPQNILKFNSVNIGYNAFNNCTKLTTINFTDTYKGTVSKSAFYNTPWFNNFNSNNNNIVTNVSGKYLVVNGCLLNYWTTSDNTVMHIPDEVKYIQDYTLTDNEFMPQITDIVAEGQVRDYGWQNFLNTAWYNNWKNADEENKSAFLTIPVGNINSDGELNSTSEYIYAANPSKFTPDTTISSNIYAIGNAVFYDNNVLQEIELPVGLKYINVNAFCNCSQLKSINIPRSIIRIENNAFNNCTNLGVGDGVLDLPETQYITSEDVYISCWAFPNYRKIQNITVNSNPITIDYFIILTDDDKKFNKLNGDVILNNSTPKDRYILQMASNIQKTPAVLNALKDYVHDFTLNELNINTSSVPVQDKINNSDLTDTEKLSILANWLYSEVSYCHFLDSSLDQGALGGLMYKYCVCAGYAQIVQFFCDEVGIKNFIAASYTHAWNLVYIEEEGCTGWYHYDQTNGSQAYMAGKQHYPDNSWYVEEYYDDLYETYADIIDQDSIQKYTYIPAVKDKSYFDIKTTKDYDSYRVEMLQDDSISKMEIYKKTENNDIKLYNVDVEYFTDAVKYSNPNIPANHNDYYVKITYKDGVQDIIPIKHLDECRQDSNFQDTSSDLNFSPYTFTIDNPENQYTYTINLRNTHNVKAYTYVYNITVTNNITIHHNENYNIKLINDNKTYTSENDVYKLPINNEKISAEIYDNNENLIYTIEDISQPLNPADNQDTIFIDTDTDTPYQISKTTNSENNYTINIASCLKYTINKQSVNNIDYDFEITTKTKYSDNPVEHIDYNAYKYRNIKDIYIKENGTATDIIIKPKDLPHNALNIDYLLNVKRDTDDIFENISLSNINTYYQKFKINSEDTYSTPFELIVTPNNSGAVLNLSDYLDGDVTLDNEVTSYDALTVLMYVVNNYSIIQTGSTGDFNMGHGNITVNGDISSNSAINIHASNGNFNGKITAPLIQTWGSVNAQRETDLKHHVPENPFSDSQMTELFFKDITHIDSDYNNDSYAAENNGETTNININQPVFANSVTLTNNVNINNNLKANGDINISGSVQNDTRCVIYSSDGNITLNSDNFSFTGLIYAPNGTVSITGNNINITGTIIAKEVIIEGDTVNFNTNNNFFNYTNINNEYFDLVGAYLSDLQIFIADIDDDGEVTMSDAKCILNKVTGNI